MVSQFASMRGASAIAIAVTIASPAAFAQEAAPADREPGRSASGYDDEIIVTATRTGETRLQDTPLAVTAVSAETLDRAGIKDIRDLVSLAPGLQVTQNATFSQVYIRGIGSNNVFGGSDPSSTMHVDGIYMARPGSYLSNFLDVERIEVLRGPQGTLYGRNSVGGTINVISRKPDDVMRARAQLTYGNYDFMRAEGYVSGPVVPGKIAASFSVLRSRRDGFLANAVPGVGDIDDEDTIGGRAQLRFTPNSRIDLVLRADYLHSDDALGGYVKMLQPTTDPVANSVLGDFRTVALNIRSASERTQWGTSADLSYDLGGATLHSLTGYRTNKLQQVGDTDGTALNIRRTDQFEGQRQFSQELNLSGTLGDLSYILGVYYFDENIQVDSSVTTFAANVRANFAPVIETAAIAGFVQANYALTDRLSLTAGARYTRERKRFDQTASQFFATTGGFRPGFPETYQLRDVYSAWTPKIGIEFRPADDVLVYASATKGFKSGGFNFASRNASQGFDPETLWSYEAGVKLELFDRLWRLNGTYFHYDYTNLQVQSFLSPGVIDITNASDATVDGVEIESLLRPVQGIQIGANLAYLDAVYKNYTTALAPGNVVFDASGNRLNLAPKWAYAAFVDLDLPVGNGSIIGRAEYSHRGRQFFTAGNVGLDQQSPYGLVNASLGYDFGDSGFRVMLFGRNLADKEYVTSTASFASGIVGRVGEPRTYGIRLSAAY
ncbi:TonB-dependent receptor [Blastomonas sp.]|uniref:TonB-dependent receptor n=1 Tax=Blastomonas sp. TaxID=1909299 RepID=UPI00262A909A|nr:TonB-dependent receptor [Blastomonas sp.]MDM7955755.1 TonB-dependent receptor [Blastomonas sp.]